MKNIYWPLLVILAIAIYLYVNGKNNSSVL